MSSSGALSIQIQARSACFKEVRRRRQISLRHNSARPERCSEVATITPAASILQRNGFRVTARNRLERPITVLDAIVAKRRHLLFGKFTLVLAAGRCRDNESKNNDGSGRRDRITHKLPSEYLA